MDNSTAQEEGEGKRATSQFRKRGRGNGWSSEGGGGEKGKRVFFFVTYVIHDLIVDTVIKKSSTYTMQFTNMASTVVLLES